MTITSSDFLNQTVFSYFADKINTTNQTVKKDMIEERGDIL
jgi:hypothetical protein